MRKSVLPSMPLRGRDLAARTLLLALVVGTFGASASYPLLWWDDRQHICANPWLMELSWANLKSIWTEAFFGLYAPVAYTVWVAPVALSKAIWGTATCPEWGPVFHSASIALHALNALLVHALLKRFDPTSRLFAFAGAAVFALHPLQTESVAWVSSTRDLVSAALGFMGLLTALSHRRWRWSLTTALFALCCLAKPSGVVFPFLATLCLWGLERENLRSSLRRLAPSLLLAGAVALITKAIQSDDALTFAVAWWQRPLVFAQNLAFYLTKVVWPFELAPDYVRPASKLFQDASDFFILWIIAPMGALAAISRSRRSLISIIWIPLALLPVSGLVSFGFQEISTVADRYFYVAMFGVAAMVQWGLARWQLQPFVRLTLATRARLWIVVGLTIGLAMSSFLQTRVWRDDETLFKHNLTLMPQSPLAHANLGNVYFHTGRHDSARNMFERAIELRSTDAQSRLGLGRSLENLGRLPEAMETYRRAIDSSAALPAIFNNLGTLHYQQSEFTEAEALWTEAARRDPSYMEPRYNLGQSKLREGKLEEARAAFEDARRTAPRDPRPLERLNHVERLLNARRAPAP